MKNDSYALMGEGIDTIAVSTIIYLGFCIIKVIIQILPKCEEPSKSVLNETCFVVTHIWPYQIPIPMEKNILEQMYFSSNEVAAM